MTRQGQDGRQRVRQKDLGGGDVVAKGLCGVTSDLVSC